MIHSLPIAMRKADRSACVGIRMSALGLLLVLYWRPTSDISGLQLLSTGSPGVNFHFGSYHGICDNESGRDLILAELKGLHNSIR